MGRSAYNKTVANAAGLDVERYKGLADAAAAAL
jgi:hypothetical protein